MNWNSPHFSTFILNAAISDNDWFESDHKLAISDYNISSLISCTLAHILKKHKPKRTFYITQNLPPDTWEKYKQHTDDLCSNVISSQFSNINDLWKLIKNILITAADANIPKKVIRKNALPPKSININNKKIKILTQLIRICKTYQNYHTPLHIQHYIKLDQTLTSLDSNIIISHPDWNSQYSIIDCISKLHNIQKALSTTRTIELKQLQNKQINAAIQQNIKRYGT